MTGSPVEPDYSAGGADNILSMNTWNYIAVSIGELKATDGSAKLRMRLVMAVGRAGAAHRGGHSDAHAKVPYTGAFSNTLYVGALDEATPLSFTGYMKELKVFNVFHEEAQLIVEKLRIHKSYSYDDIHLVSYWRLSENYTSTDEQYVLQDDALDGGQFSVNLQVTPLYPQFVVDTSIALMLCHFHDVATCLAVDSSEGRLARIATDGWRIGTVPDFDIADLSHTITDGDEIWYVPGGKCIEANLAAKMVRQNNAWAPVTGLEPADLLDEMHYEVCYKIASEENAIFSVGQVYLAGQPKRVAPSDGSSYKITGVRTQWDIADGD